MNIPVEEDDATENKVKYRVKLSDEPKSIGIYVVDKLATKYRGKERSSLIGKISRTFRDDAEAGLNGLPTGKTEFEAHEVDTWLRTRVWRNREGEPWALADEIIAITPARRYRLDCSPGSYGVSTHGAHLTHWQGNSAALYNLRSRHHTEMAVKDAIIKNLQDELATKRSEVTALRDKLTKKRKYNVDCRRRDRSERARLKNDLEFQKTRNKTLQERLEKSTKK